MRSWIVVGLCAACGPGERAPAPPDAPDPLPPGAWEPAPGRHHGYASLAAGDAGSVWWAYGETSVVDADAGLHETHVWLTQTTATGVPLMTPTLVDPIASGPSRALAVSRDKVAVALTTGDRFYVRRYTRNGVPSDAVPREIEVLVAGQPARGTGEIGLVVSSTGGMRVAAPITNTQAGVVAIVALDAAGDPLGTSIVGAVDDGFTSSISVASAADDSLVLAWDTRYDQCSGPRPPVTHATSITATPQPIFVVGDVPERGEQQPVVASAGDTQYIAWVSDQFAASSRIALARFPAMTTLVEIGTGDFNVEPKLALAAADRGAIAWLAGDNASIQVVSFQDVAGAIRVSAPHAVEHAPTPGFRLDGLVHVGGERYVLAWTEALPDQQGTRLLATQLDLATDERQHLAPPPAQPSDLEQRPARRTALGLVPCTH